MERLKPLLSIAAAMLLMSATVQADDIDWEDIFAPYRQRIDTITPSTGNAQDVNTATQMITPWPPYVTDRHIPGDGARMTGAVERYHNPMSSGGLVGPAQSNPASTQEAGTDSQGGANNANQPGGAEGSGQ